MTYSPSIEKHHLTFLVGNSLFRTEWSNLGGSKQGLLIPDAEHAYLDLAKNETSAQTWGGINQGAFVSYFGRFNYTYSDLYMFTSSFRSDGSIKFGPNNRFGYFPSFSAGWNMSNEPFMKQNENIEALKLRVSWGQNGNDKIGDYLYKPTISFGARGYTFNDVIYPGASPARIANPDLKWETSEQTNIGVDVRFLHKFSASLDLYSKTTKDLLIEVPVSTMLGAERIMKNAGSVSNKGVELVLGYNDKSHDFAWNVDFNITYNKNKVESIGNGDEFIGGSSVGTAMTNVTRMETGQPLPYFWGFVTDGIFQNASEVAAHKSSAGTVIQPEAQAGDFRYKDLNDDGVINDKDRTNIGKPIPDFVAGLTLGLSWKHWSISSLFNAMYGNDVFNGSRRWDFPMSNYQTTVLDRWVGEGSTNTYPRVSTTDVNKNFSRVSSFFIEDGSFIRLKNLTLAYTFNGIKPLMIQSLKIYASATNLFTLTKYTGLDPEIGSQNVFDIGLDKGIYPQPRTYTIGATVTF